MGCKIVQLIEFNKASSQDVRTFLKHCVQIPRWSDELLQQRPYSDVDALLAYSRQRASTWTWDEIKVALDLHPRIGEKKAQQELSASEQAFSKREQSSITSDVETQKALFTGNVAYEKKYGFIFLIKAFGLDSLQVLQALKYRLLNDLDTEKRIVHQQLTEIALLRLAQEIQA